VVTQYWSTTIYSRNKVELRLGLRTAEIALWNILMMMMMMEVRIPMDKSCSDVAGEMSGYKLTCSRWQACWFLAPCLMIRSCGLSVEEILWAGRSIDLEDSMSFQCLSPFVPPSRSGDTFVRS
jgi:hypothetical protein